MRTFLEIVYFVYVGVLLPYAIIRGTKRASKAPPKEINPSKASLVSLAILWFLGLFAIVCAHRLYIPLFPQWNPKWPELVAGLIFFSIAVASRQVMQPWLKKSVPPGFKSLLPSNIGGLSLWVALSISAGFCEEIVYRGVLYYSLADLTTNAWIAFVLSSLVFGVNHYNQGFRAVLFISTFALGLQGLVVWSGTLYTAIIVHAIYDIALGLLALRPPRRRDRNRS